MGGSGAAEISHLPCDFLAPFLAAKSAYAVEAAEVLASVITEDVAHQERDPPVTGLHPVQRRRAGCSGRAEK
jgi:hypothetical protein